MVYVRIYSLDIQVHVFYISSLNGLARAREKAQATVLELKSSTSLDVENRIDP